VFRKRDQDRQSAVRSLAEAKEVDQPSADQLAGGPPQRARAGRRDLGQGQGFVCLKGPIGCSALEIRLSFGLGSVGRTGGEANGPTADLKRDILPVRLGPYPQIDIAFAIGGDGGAGDGDAEPACEPGKGSDLRNGQCAAGTAAGMLMQSEQWRVGLDQPPFRVDAAADRLGSQHAHAASAEVRARVEMRATLAR
jgi:hypothetical protein